jgi:hypothetical protein
VKTVGDAVMAAFHDPADVVRAVLAMEDEVKSFNRGRSDGGIVLKRPGSPRGAGRARGHRGLCDFARPERAGAVRARAGGEDKSH